MSQHEDHGISRAVDSSVCALVHKLVKKKVADCSHALLINQTGTMIAHPIDMKLIVPPSLSRRFRYLVVAAANA